MREISGWNDLRKRPLAKQFKQTLEGNGFPLDLATEEISQHPEFRLLTSRTVRELTCCLTHYGCGKLLQHQ